MGDVEQAGISFSYHSDMPMAPADPLFLMWCGVNRQTVSGRVAGAHQRVSRAGALRAVTLDAAHSLKMANFTILDDNPVNCPPLHIRDIGVWGTVHEGRMLPVVAPPSPTPSPTRRPSPHRRSPRHHSSRRQSSRHLA